MGWNEDCGLLLLFLVFIPKSAYSFSLSRICLSKSSDIASLVSTRSSIEVKISFSISNLLSSYFSSNSDNYLFFTCIKTSSFVRVTSNLSSSFFSLAFFSTAKCQELVRVFFFTFTSSNIYFNFQSFSSSLERDFIEGSSL